MFRLLLMFSVLAMTACSVDQPAELTPEEKCQILLDAGYSSDNRYCAVSDRAIL